MNTHPDNGRTEAAHREQLLLIATTATDAAAKLLQIAAAASEALKVPMLAGWKKTPLRASWTHGGGV